MSGLTPRDSAHYCADPSKYGAYRYYCEFFCAVNASADIVLADCHKRNATGRSPSRCARNSSVDAEALFLPFHCTRKPNILIDCFADIMPGDPPVVVILNKMFEGEMLKIQYLRRFRHKIALIMAMTPRVDLYSRATGIRGAVLPYGVLPDFGQFADAGPTMAYKQDLGFSGGWHRFSTRYPFRKELFQQNMSRVRALRASGVRVYLPNSMLPKASYIRALAETRIWFATSERGDHVSTRVFEVLASGRALLLCDRNPTGESAFGVCLTHGPVRARRRLAVIVEGRWPEDGGLQTVA